MCVEREGRVRGRREGKGGSTYLCVCVYVCVCVCVCVLTHPDVHAMHTRMPLHNTR